MARYIEPMSDHGDDSALADVQARTPLSPETATRMLGNELWKANEPCQRRLSPAPAVISLARVACVATAVAAAAALVLAAAPRVLS